MKILTIFLVCSISEFTHAKNKEKDEEERLWVESWRKSCKKKDFGCSVWCQVNSVPGLPFYCGGVCQGWFQDKCTCVFCPPGTEFLFPFPNIYPLTHGRPLPTPAPGGHEQPKPKAPNRDQQFLSEAIIPFRRFG